MKRPTGSCFEAFSMLMVLFSEVLETLGGGTKLEE